MPDVVRPCVLPKGGDVMPCPTSSDRVLSYGGDVMPCPTMCAVQERLSHDMPHVFLLWVQSKGGNGMPRQTSSDLVCYPTAVMACRT